jgi:hypothetical protein
LKQLCYDNNIKQAFNILDRSLASVLLAILSPTFGREETKAAKTAMPSRAMMIDFIVFYMSWKNNYLDENPPLLISPVPPPLACRWYARACLLTSPQICG